MREKPLKTLPFKSADAKTLAAAGMRRSRGQQHKLILLSVTQTDPLNLLLLIRAEAFLGSFTSPQTGGGATLKRLPCLWLDRSVYVSGRVFCCFLRRVPLMKLAC